MPNAARVSDNHACPAVDPGPTPHVGGPIISGCDTVVIENQHAARLGDQAVCVGPGATDVIASGSSTVIIADRAASRLGDPMAHGGVIVQGADTVFIGDETYGEPAPKSDVEYVLDFELTSTEKPLHNGRFEFIPSGEE